MVEIDMSKEIEWLRVMERKKKKGRLVRMRKRSMKLGKKGDDNYG